MAGPTVNALAEALRHALNSLAHVFCGKHITRFVLLETHSPHGLAAHDESEFNKYITSLQSSQAAGVPQIKWPPFKNRDLHPSHTSKISIVTDTLTDPTKLIKMLYYTRIEVKGQFLTRGGMGH